MRARVVGLTTLAAACLVVAAATASGQDTPLVAGSELVYESNGQRNTWRVELVERGIARGGWTGCLRVRFAPGGPRATPDDRVTCEVDGVLHAWDSTASRWRPTRPTRADSYLELPGRTTLSEYRTGAEREETIGGTTLRTVETTVITTDSTGRQVRRLRERYAPALGTATWGVFEAPDPAAEGGWRVQVEFALVEIRRP